MGYPRVAQRLAGKRGGIKGQIRLPDPWALGSSANSLIVPYNFDCEDDLAGWIRARLDTLYPGPVLKAKIINIRRDDPAFIGVSVMAWAILFFAGLIEIGWAIGLKYTEGFTKLVPSV